MTPIAPFSSTQSAFKGLPKLVHLDLYGNKLTCFSPCTIHCSKHNHPHTNRQQKLLSKLEYLDVGYNQLTVLPDEVATLPSLKILKCPNNLIEVIPSSICEMELRVLDVSSNPLVQPPLETCERGLHSMRRYYHCLKLEEMTGPNFQQNKQSKYIFKKTRVKSMMKSSVGVGGSISSNSTKKKFPSSLCSSSMFRNISEPNGQCSMLPSASSISSSWKGEGGNTLRSRSFSLKGSPPNERRRTTEGNLPSSTAKQPSQQQIEGYYSDESVTSDATEPTVNNKAEQMAATDKITVNDTLKVIFVGMALSGKTSIIKRLIEGKDAKIPKKDERTIGVDIYEWDVRSKFSSLDTHIPVDKELESRMDGTADVKFSVWDFAGQHVYHVSTSFSLQNVNLHFTVSPHIIYAPHTYHIHRLHTNSSFPVNHSMSLFGIWVRIMYPQQNAEPPLMRLNMVHSS